MNINYSKIAKIASELEKQLGIQDEIDERTEKEIESQPDLPQPSVEASEINIEEINFQGDLKIENEEEIEQNELEDSANELKNEITNLEKEFEECEDQIIPEFTDDDEDDKEEDEEDEQEKNASKIAHLTRLIKLAKAVKNTKKLNAEEKKEALKEIEKASKKGATNLKIKKTDLNKLLSGDISRIMKQTQKFNDVIKNNKSITLNQAIKEMKAWGAKNDVTVDFPAQILNKTVGSCNAAWLIELGPMIANMLNKYEELKNSSQEEE